MKNARLETGFWWKGGDGKKQNEEDISGELEKALQDFIQVFGKGGWETQTSLLHGIDQSAEGGSHQPAGDRKEWQGEQAGRKFCSTPSM
jgi:hypothetical protein